MLHSRESRSYRNFAVVCSLACLVPASASGQAGLASPDPLPKFCQGFTQASLPEEELDYILVELNGEAKMVKNKGSLAFVRGDTLKLRQAVLKRSEKSVGEVNVVGYQPPERGPMKDDREWLIDTAKFLHNGDWSVDAAGKTYVATVTTKRLMHGYVYFERHEPALRYVAISVNQQPRVMRVGETLRVKANDMFKVKEVVTNLSSSKNVRFQIVKRSQRPQKTAEPATDAFDIVFSHRSRVFAKLPVIVEAI